jgi:hypothetical protein
MLNRVVKLFHLVLFISLLPLAACAQQRPRRVASSAGQIVVAAGDDLQKAINSAKPGETLVLEAGARFPGPITLPLKQGEGFITIQTSSISQLKDGMRVSPNDALLMPKILSMKRGDSAIQTSPGAHNYRIIGVEFATKDPSTFSYGLVSLGSDAVRAMTEFPHDLVIDRCYIHSEGPSRRGIALNSAATTISNSYISGFKEQGADSQAICGWNGPGPYRIINNYLEGAGENILFGGADPSIADLRPSNIEIRGNHLSKPLAWRGGPWVVKNLLELKNASQVVIDGNLLENNWSAGQNGTAILFTPRNQDGKAPWSGVRDVTLSNNIVRHAVNGIGILGADYNHPSGPAEKIKITNNLFYDIDPAKWGSGSGGLFVGYTGTGGANLEINHNTAIHSGACLSFEDGSKLTNLVATNNIMRFHILGSGMVGTDVMSRFIDGRSEIRNNAIVLSERPDYWQPHYPAMNFFPLSYDQIGFSDVAGGDFSLRPSSKLKNRATDKSDVGVDYSLLKSAFDSDHEPH